MVVVKKSRKSWLNVSGGVVCLGLGFELVVVCELVVKLYYWEEVVVEDVFNVDVW